MSAPRPELAHDSWARSKLAAIPCTQWLAAKVQLQTALQAVQRLPEHEQAPLLLDIKSDSAWWLVPHDAAEQLADVSSVTLLPLGSPLHCPPARRAVGGRVWLVGPDGSGRVIDPVYLAAALGPGSGPRLPAEAFG
ncbi:hypothetical protein [Streptomyces sp. KN37]|uniref:hypothetical protein n=1 Tax=Streptomyces sp. KN37 TaxID=3090667 RepID=UPI002A755FA5|nr:hypothetical protein [Streptomyces sp. KN37]WPO76255.1 hypothetical protein R9806_36880 [Streptomyces sp. KN37]